MQGKCPASLLFNLPNDAGQVQEREAYICPVTGHIDESLNKLEPERFRALLTERCVESDKMDAALIIPLALPVGENDTEAQVSVCQQTLLLQCLCVGR